MIQQQCELQNEQTQLGSNPSESKDGGEAPTVHSEKMQDSEVGIKRTSKWQKTDEKEKHERKKSSSKSKCPRDRKLAKSSSLLAQKVTRSRDAQEIDWDMQVFDKIQFSQGEDEEQKIIYEESEKFEDCLQAIRSGKPLSGDERKLKILTMFKKYHEECKMKKGKGKFTF